MIIILLIIRGQNGRSMDGGTQAGGRRLPTREVLKTQGPKAFRIIEAQLVEKEGLTGTAAMQRRERCTKVNPKSRPELLQ
jgi:hypothetical protein